MQLNSLRAGPLAAGLIFGLAADPSATETTARDCSEVLPVTAKFFDAKHSGETRNWLLARNPVGTTCHLQDGEASAPGNDLTGAMVGGPTEEAQDVTKAGYEDNIADYIGNEVTIYYNSALVGALAFAASSSAP